MSNEPEQARHEFGAPDEREVLAHEPVDSDMATDYTRVGENVADVLASAQRAAAQMLRSAREEADRIRSDAQEQAAETEQRARYVAQEEVRRQEALAAGAERYEERLKNLLEVFRGMTTQLEDLIRTNREAKDRDEDSEEAEQDAEAPADEAAFEEALRPERPTHAHTTWPRGR